MTKTVSATEAKNSFGALLGQIGAGEEVVIVENRGVAAAAMISIERYRALMKYEEKERRHQTLEAFRRLRSEIADQTKDMSDEEIESMISEISTEIDGKLNAQYRANIESRDVS